MSRIKVVFVGLLIIAGLLVADSGSSVHAYIPDPRTFIAGDNVFYAYLRSGEKLNVNFNRANQPPIGETTPQQISMTVDAPGLSEQACTIPANIPLGNGCSFNLTAVKDGIWRVNFELPANALIDPTISSTIKWGADLFNWNITVSDSGGEKPGRVWSELYGIAQEYPRSALADLTFYYVSEDGYIYRVLYRGFNGIFAILSADAYGNVKAGTCETAYQSVDANNSAIKPAFGSCGGGATKNFLSNLLMICQRRQPVGMEHRTGFGLI